MTNILTLMNLMPALLKVYFLVMTSRRCNVKSVIILAEGTQRYHKGMRNLFGVMLYVKFEFLFFTRASCGRPESKNVVRSSSSLFSTNLTPGVFAQALKNNITTNLVPRVHVPLDQRSGNVDSGNEIASADCITTGKPPCWICKKRHPVATYGSKDASNVFTFITIYDHYSIYFVFFT